MVLSVLHTKAPLQFQRKWRRIEPCQRFRTTVRAASEGTHYRTSRIKTKTLYMELVPEEARDPYRDTQETATSQAVRLFAACSNGSWLKNALLLSRVPVPSQLVEQIDLHAEPSRAIPRPQP